MIPQETGKALNRQLNAASKAAGKRRTKKVPKSAEGKISQKSEQK